MFTSAAILLSYFGEERSGGGGGGGGGGTYTCICKVGGGSKPGIAPRARHISKFSWGSTPKPPARRGCYP